jgi:hypothetical protein
MVGRRTLKSSSSISGLKALNKRDFSNPSASSLKDEAFSSSRFLRIRDLHQMVEEEKISTGNLRTVASRRTLMSSVKDLKVFSSLRSDDLRDSPPQGSDEPFGNPNVNPHSHVRSQEKRHAFYGLFPVL